MSQIAQIERNRDRDGDREKDRNRDRDIRGPVPQEPHWSKEMNIDLRADRLKGLEEPASWRQEPHIPHALSPQGIELF